jgi:hypothetical protein
MAYKLLPAEQKEDWLFYRLDSEVEKRCGAIGYLRADFGGGGQEFWTTWVDLQTGLKTPDFQHEFQDVIDSLRNDGAKPPFASRANLQSYCAENAACPLTGNAVGFAIRTLNHTYTFRCAPRRGDYDIYCFAFNNRFLLSELAGRARQPSPPKPKNREDR